jgi:hypothetical protein
MLQRVRKRTFMNNMGRFNMSSGVRKPPLNGSYINRSNAITEILDVNP